MPGEQGSTRRSRRQNGGFFGDTSSGRASPVSFAVAAGAAAGALAEVVALERRRRGQALALRGGTAILELLGDRGNGGDRCPRRIGRLGHEREQRDQRIARGRIGLGVLHDGDRRGHEHAIAQRHEVGRVDLTPQQARVQVRDRDPALLARRSEHVLHRRVMVSTAVSKSDARGEQRVRAPELVIVLHLLATKWRTPSTTEPPSPSRW